MNTFIYFCKRIAKVIAKIKIKIEKQKEMKEKITIDLRTEAEKQRDELHAHICADYRQVLKEQPHARPYRVMAVIGNRYGMTTQGIAALLRRTGDYAPQAK